MQTTDDHEQEWLLALRNHDATALRRIFDRYYRRLLNDVFPIIPDQDTAKDVVQEVFVELWKKRDHIDVKSSLGAYLRRAAVNRAINHVKANRRTVLDLPDELEQNAVLPEEPTETTVGGLTLEEALQMAVKGLPEKCRLVFTLSRFEQMPHRDIAEKLGISVKTIENQITKALRTLRETLAQYRDLSAIVILQIINGLFG